MTLSIPSNTTHGTRSHVHEASLRALGASVKLGGLKYSKYKVTRPMYHNITYTLLIVKTCFFENGGWHGRSDAETVRPSPLGWGLLRGPSKLESPDHMPLSRDGTWPLALTAQSESGRSLIFLLLPSLRPISLPF
jgi:hypothetical protein